MSEIFTHLAPPSHSLPLIFDSPHSGRRYPPDFGFSCPRPVLERAEDRFMDKLLRWAPAQGIALLLAEFPRSYIDVNRAVTDIDITMLDGPWPAAAPTDLSRDGIGLIRRLLTPTLNVYDRLLAVDELQHRIDTYYRPYYTALHTLMTDTHRKHGVVLHINWHSMPSRFTGGIRMPDIVIGSRHGITCPTLLVQAAQRIWQKMGYSVQLDDPYPGQEIIRQTGRPQAGYFALQLEVNKALYLDEWRNSLTPNHHTLIQSMQIFAEQMGQVMQEYTQPMAAD